MTIRHERGSYKVDFTRIADVNAQRDASWRIVSDTNVWRHWGHHFPGSDHFCVAPGESSKSLACFGDVVEWLAATGADRTSHLLALGGGVVGDITGFAAATFMRGIRYSMAPTTLLAQVDSSIGGKTGVNLRAGKNLVGSFHPPSNVWICAETLGTLPRRELISGLSEIIKHAAISDRAMFEELEQSSEGKIHSDLEEHIKRSLAIKASAVQADEFERVGLRAILNFGHSVGHALEKLLGYGSLLHGEAVAIGMVVEGRIGEKLGITRPGSAKRIAELAGRLGLSTDLPDVDALQMLEAMKLDKKSSSGTVSMALLTDVGQCKLMNDLPDQPILDCLNPKK